MDAVTALRRVAFLLERTQAATYRVKAFRTAASAVQDMGDGELADRLAHGSLEAVRGIGPRTAEVIRQAHSGATPDYLDRLEREASRPLAQGGETLLAALRGDCHTHSDWSDGGSPVEEMGRTAAELGHEWTVLTDHSPRLTVANGLSPERLRRQLDVVAELNERWAPFRLLTGIECDILPDGSLDQEPDLLERLDVVVVSVHSKLRRSGCWPQCAGRTRTCSGTARGVCWADGGARSRCSTRTRSSPPARSRGRPWRSTAVPSGSIRPAT